VNRKYRLRITTVQLTFNPLHRPWALKIITPIIFNTCTPNLEASHCNESWPLLRYELANTSWSSSKDMDTADWRRNNSQLETDVAECRGAWTSWRAVATDQSRLRVMMMMMMMMMIIIFNAVRKNAYFTWRSLYLRDTHADHVILFIYYFSSRNLQRSTIGYLCNSYVSC